MFIHKARFGRFLKKARKKSGVSQQALVNNIGLSSPQYVSNWERGICSAPVDKLYELMECLKIDPEELITEILSYNREYLINALRLPREKRRTPKADS